MSEKFNPRLGGIVFPQHSSVTKCNYVSSSKYNWFTCSLDEHGNDSVVRLPSGNRSTMFDTGSTKHARLIDLLASITNPLLSYVELDYGLYGRLTCNV